MTPRPATLERSKKVARGQPVIALAMVIGLWVAARVTFIALGGDPMTGGSSVAQLARAVPGNHPARQPIVPPAPDRQSARIAPLAAPYMPRRSGGSAASGPVLTRLADGFAASGRARALLVSSGGPEAAMIPPEELAATCASAQPAGPSAASLSTGRSRLAYLALPFRAGGGTAAEPGPNRLATPHRSHWSADGWLLLRGGSELPALAAGTAAYGGSQAGAVLRYAFAPAGALRPQAYVRVSGALGGGVRQSEAALGLIVRPVKRLPIAVLGEARLLDQPGQLRTRPVVLAITELPPLRLPLGTEAEAYAQGGWAGGRDATAFYDLAATLQHRVVHPLPGLQLSAGGGVWSGGQRGASRLDVGPRVELRTMLGPPSRRIGVRIGVDWRLRVAGRAESGSGPALTMSAGF
jgi:hypothetical protein